MGFASMDIQRTPDPSRKNRRRLLIAGAILGGLALVTVSIRFLGGGAPSMDRSQLWIDTVREGEMVRQVRGIGTLVPEEIRWLAARSAGRVDEIVLRPGALVTPESVILVLANPDVEQAAKSADSQLQAAEAELVNLRVQLQRSVLEAEATANQAHSAFETARLRAEVNAELFKDGLVSHLDLRLSEVTAEQASKQNEIETKRFAFAKESTAPQLAVKQAEVDRLRAQAQLRRDELAALHVRAGMSGVLSALPVEVGAQVQPGTNLARVANPTRLKAEIRVPEIQAKDLVIGQKASVDTRNGVVTAKVMRIDPAVQAGTVTVDLSLEGALPAGARPDLTVDGTIELESLGRVAFVGRPSFARERAQTTLFVVNEGGNKAQRVSVTFGRASVNTIEITQGLKAGDRVILTELSQWDGYNQLRIK